MEVSTWDLYGDIDEAMVPFHEHLAGMLDVDGFAESEEEGGCRMMIKKIGIDSPVQLDILVDEEGQVTIGSSPPLYYVATGVLPVFHAIRLNAFTTETENEAEYETGE